jgi:hypothetical protein
MRKPDRKAKEWLIKHNRGLATKPREYHEGTMIGFFLVFCTIALICMITGVILTIWG